MIDLNNMPIDELKKYLSENNLSIACEDGKIVSTVLEKEADFEDEKEI